MLCRSEGEIHMMDIRIYISERKNVYQAMCSEYTIRHICIDNDIGEEGEYMSMWGTVDTSFVTYCTSHLPRMITPSHYHIAS